MKRKSLDVGKGLKSLSRKRHHQDLNVDRPVAAFVVSGSGDNAIVQSKQMHLEPPDLFVSHTTAVTSTSVVTGLVSTATHSVNSNVLRPETESVSNVVSTLQITSQMVVSDTLGAAVTASSSAVTSTVTEACSRRIQHLKFTAAPVTSATSATGHGLQQTSAIAVQPSNTRTNDTAPAQQNTIADGIYLLWQNEDSLCWLDVAMALIVNCEGLRGILTQLGRDSCLNRLLTSFESAQVDFRRSRKLYRCHYLCGQGKAVTLETSVGQVTVKTGGGHGPFSTSLLGGASPVVASIDLDDISSIVSADSPHSTSLEKVSQEAKRLEQKSKQLMVQTRDEVFQSLQPRMHCKRGECDSVLIALTEMLSLDETVRSHFTVHYTYSLSCTCCGQPESGTYVIISLPCNFQLSCV